MNNKIVASSALPIILSIWLLVSVLMGAVLSFIIDSTFFFDFLYSNYKGHINSYNLFCCIMGVALLLWPFASLFIWKNGFDNIVLRKGGSLVFSICAVVGLLVGLGQTNLEGNNKMTSLLRGAVHFSDWAGAALFAFSGLFVFTSCVVVIIKRKGMRNGGN